MYACAYQGVRNIRFSENLACFVFLKQPFLDLPFCLITDDILEVFAITIFEEWLGSGLTHLIHWLLIGKKVMN